MTGRGPTVLLVDDDAPFRRLASELLAGLGYRVIAEAGDGAQALAECDRRRPDAVLLDVNLPDGDGFALARAITGAGGAPRVLLTSTDVTAGSAEAVAESGAVGFVPKGELAVTDLVRYLGA
jgi:CheY-like chemotaxis protein